MNTANNENLLVVDDEEIMRDLISTILSDEGYNITVAENGNEALAKLEGNNFALLITDLKMPAMGGVELMKKVKQKYPALPIMVMTGFASFETAREAIKNGAFDYIMKPFDIDEIRTAVNSVLERLRLVSENTRLKETMSLFEVTEEIGRTVNLQKILDLVLKSALKQTGATRGSLMLIHDKEKQLYIQASVGIDEDIVKSTKINLGEGIAGNVAKNGNPVLISDVDEHPLYSKLCHNFKDKSFMSVPILDSEHLFIPLKTTKKVIGVLNVNKQLPGKIFTEADLNILSILAGQAATSIENAKLFKNLEESYINTIQSLILILEGKSPYTKGHSERVTEYAVKIAKRMNLTNEEISTLRYGAILHDIGKIGIDDKILNKPGKLTDEEYTTIKKHTLLGYEMLKPIKFLKKALPVIRNHHERMDGKGYPDGISGKDLPMLVKISVVADAYDAMTSNRPYRDLLNVKKTRNELEKNIGTQFDKDVVAALIKIEKI